MRQFLPSAKDEGVSLTPKIMKYVVGDLHGCYYTLVKLLEKIDKQDHHPEYIFVGDYFDRGKWPNKVIDLLIDLKSQGAVCLRGNHDDVLDYIVNKQCIGDPLRWVRVPANEEKIISWWLGQGFDSVLRAYGVAEPTISFGMHGAKVLQPDAKKVVDDMQQKVPDSHKKFVRNLDLYWEGDSHFAIHAYLDPRTKLPRDMKFLKINPQEALWMRFRFPDFIQPEWDKTGVFGHTPADEPLKFKRMRFVDTGAFLGNKLTAYCCDTDKFISVSAEEEDLVC